MALSRSMVRRPIRRPCLVLVMSSILALLCSCGLLGGESGTDADPAQVEKSRIRLGVLPIIDVASVHIAQRRGYFAEEGLDVELVTVQGGAAAIPSLVKGELDITFTNWVSLFLAQSQGVDDFRIISDGSAYQENNFLILARSDSSVKNPADLAGKRLAVNTRNNIVELTARSALTTQGVDPNTVTFVEVPFPGMVSALDQGTVDAAELVEPFITQGKLERGLTTVLDAASGPTAGIPSAGFTVTSTFATENPATVTAFQRAMTRGQLAASDPAVLQETLPQYLEIPPNATPLVNPPAFPTTLSAIRLQRVQDLMSTFGVLSGPPLDVQSMLIPLPPPR